MISDAACGEHRPRVPGAERGQLSNRRGDAIRDSLEGEIPVDP